MRRPFALLSALLPLCLACAVPVAAQQVSTRSWTDADGVLWTETTTVEVVDEDAAPEGPEMPDGSDRLVPSHGGAAPVRGIARFGPFVVVDGARAALVAETDGRSPAAFAAMIAAFPQIAVLEMVDCPGTVDDTANLELGRRIRAAGLATDVPPGGSVRSGAVELFLAGTTRHVAPDAEFAVHAWQDDDGLGPSDFAANASVNAAYLRYYREMGLPVAQAEAFYALTNSVPNDQVRWLDRADIARYAALD